MTENSHGDLKRWYRSYNRRYFYGQLPKNMEVIYAPRDEEHGLAVDSTEDAPAKIIIDTMLAGTRYARLTLIHEMCHHFTRDFGHGKRFQEGMLRVASLGGMKDLW